MSLGRGLNMLKAVRFSNNVVVASSKLRMSTTTPSGSYLPEPKKPRFVFLRVVAAVSIGLLIGANISKNIANFLEENELFVPSDDDDDD